MSEGSTTRRYLKILLGLAIVGAIVWFFASGTYHSVQIERVSREIRAFGTLAPIAFVLGYTLIQPLGPSGHIFVLAASLVWEPPLAFGLSLAGAVGSQLVMFVFFRYVAGDWARQRLPARILRWEGHLVARPFRTAFAIRALTFGWHLSAMVIGVSRVPFWPMLGGTVLGLMVPVGFDVFALDTVRGWLT